MSSRNFIRVEIKENYVIRLLLHLFISNEGRQDLIMTEKMVGCTNAYYRYEWRNVNEKVNEKTVEYIVTVTNFTSHVKSEKLINCGISILMKLRSYNFSNLFYGGIFRLLWKKLTNQKIFLWNSIKRFIIKNNWKIIS